MFPYTFKCLKRFPLWFEEMFRQFGAALKIISLFASLRGTQFHSQGPLLLEREKKRKKKKERRRGSKLYTGDLLEVKCQQSLLRSPAIDCTIAANNSRICLTFVSLSCVIHQKQHLHLTGHTYESVYEHMTSLVTRVMLFESSLSQLKCSRV